MNEISSNNKIKSFQSLRGFFIILIVLEHISVNKFLSFIGAGGEGASFFFVLSGFLAGYLYINKDFDFSLSGQKSFLVKKILKFYPLHILSLVIYLSFKIIELLISSEGTVKAIFILIIKFFLNASFLQVYIPINGWYMNEINGASWFLATMVFCYANTIIALFLIKKYKQQRIILLISLLIIYFSFSYLVKDTFLSTYLLYVFPIHRYVEYLISMIIGSLIIDNKKKIKMISASIIEITSILLLICNHILIKNKVYDGYKNLLYNSIFIISLIMVISFSFQGGVISRLLDNKFLFNIGENSFYIFIMHQVIINIITYIFGWNLIGFISSIVCIVIYCLLIPFVNNKLSSIAKRIINIRNSKINL